MSPTLCTLGIDIWEHVAYYALSGDDNFFGPPSGICSLCFISREIYNYLCFDNNSRLYARLFRFKYDFAAVRRRLSPRWTNTRSLALELKKRVCTLERIRQRHQLDTDDLWTCYLMMLENDGRNERHLVEYASLYQYLHKFTIIRFKTSSWYDDSEDTALTLWLWWMMFYPEALGRESSSTRGALTGTLLPEFIYAGHSYPSVYAPDGHFDLPLSPEQHNIVSCSGPGPSTRRLIHYGNQLNIAAPLLTPAALLVWIVRVQSYADVEPFDATAMKLPPNRQTADLVGWRGPTIEDVVEYRKIRVGAPERCALNLEDGEDDNFDGDGGGADETNGEESRHGSRRYDNDWYRLVSCHDPWADNLPLRGAVFRIGSLAGSWGGRFLQTNVDVHMDILRHRESYRKKSAAMYSRPLFWELEEHHCLEPNVPVDPGLDDFGGDDFLSAWFPRHCQVKHLEDAIEVYDTRTQRTSRYETYLGAGSACYSNQVCDKLQSTGIWDEGWEDEAEEDPNVGSENQEYVDVVTHRDSGIRDILITGKTSERHGSAWGSFHIIGRIRSWDGLVVLLRTPVQDDEEMGRLVFRGYLHDGNFVGRWRETNTAADVVGYEGGFVVCRI